MRVRDPGQSIRINDCDPAKTFGCIGQPIQNGLANIRNPRSHKEALADNSEAQGHAVEAAIRILLRPAEVAQGGQQTMRRAFRHVQTAGDLAKRQRTGILAQQGNEVKAAFDERFDKPHGTT